VDEVEVDTPLKNSGFRILNKVKNWALGKYETFLIK